MMALPVNMRDSIVFCNRRVIMFCIVNLFAKIYKIPKFIITFGIMILKISINFGIRLLFSSKCSFLAVTGMRHPAAVSVLAVDPEEYQVEERMSARLLP